MAIQKKTREPANADKAYDYAIFLLSLKLRTVGEMISKMQGRGYTQLVIEQTIDKLKQYNYVNDRQYAEIFLENLKTYRYFGFYGIKKKFIEKKLPKELIDQILTEGLTLKEEELIARRFLKRQGFESEKQEEEQAVLYRTFESQESNKTKNKIANRLKSRGFRAEIISKLVF